MDKTPCNPPYSSMDKAREKRTEHFICNSLNDVSNVSNIPLLRYDKGVLVLNDPAVTDELYNELRKRKLTCSVCHGYFSWYMWNGHKSVCIAAPGSCKYCGYGEPTYLVGFPHKRGCRGISGNFHRCETSYFNVNTKVISINTKRLVWRSSTERRRRRYTNRLTEPT